jgi:hypothetical protein
VQKALIEYLLLGRIESRTVIPAQAGIHAVTDQQLEPS